MANRSYPLRQFIDSSARVALAAFLHDLGKFAERANIEADPVNIEANQHLYCPHHKQNPTDRGWFSHKHAAYTAIALDLIEPHLPPLKGYEIGPFATWRSSNVDDSLINAAARHHKPDTFLQWVVATADRIASGFEREEFERYNDADEGTVTGKNHYTARQLTLFEQIRVHDQKRTQEYAYRYRLAALSPNALMPVKASGYEPSNNQDAQSEYGELWNGFVAALKDEIPRSHRDNLALWLDHFETLWGCFTHAIPSATAGNTRPDVSLYDHSRAVAALAVALWRYHHERGDDMSATTQAMRDRADWDEEKFLLIQGDFFGIQDFIFASGGETQKRAAVLLRGRSFYVSLLTECAALRILDDLGLPPTSQIVNAAGKFLIVAPNTEAVRACLADLQATLNDWFLQYSWGLAGIGLAWLPASGNNFLSTKKAEKTCFQQLMERLFAQLERTKLQRLSLCGNSPPNPVFAGYLDAFEHGECKIDGRSPATHPLEKDVWIGGLARDQIAIGKYLVNHERLLITREPINHNTLQLPIFGYSINFTDNQETSGKFGELARSGALLRAWDFSLPDKDAPDKPLWNGYARRYINAFVPRFTEANEWENEKSKKYALEEDQPVQAGDLKTLNHLACEDRQPDAQGAWYGVRALMTLKGDVDNLGLIFQHGLNQPTFAKMAALSRQMNAFFAIYLPYRCQQEFPNTYTVFAGGDDFFLIGPWYSQICLANKMRGWFAEYTAHNPELHFSAGLVMTKPGLPIPHLAEAAEEALDAAKEHGKSEKPGEPAPKNAVNCYSYSVHWREFDELMQRFARLQDLTREHKLSTGYLYGLLQLTDMQARLNECPENALWHAWFAYRTRRMLDRTKGLQESDKRRLQQQLADEIANRGIEKFAGAYKIALFTYLYQQRD